MVPESYPAEKSVHRSGIAKEAEIVSIQGDGWVRFTREKEWMEAVREQTLTSGDFIKTGNYGRMSILFIDDTQIKIHNRTILVIKEVRKPAEKKGTVLRLESGEIWSRAKSVPESLRIETPSAIAAIRGTDWDMTVDERGTSYLTVLRGTVDLFNDYGRVTVNPGEQATAETGKPPAKTFLVRPKDRVQWVTSYPVDIPRLVCFHSHRRDEVTKLLASAREKAEKSPSDIELRLHLAGLLFDLKEEEESLKLFDEVLASEPLNCRALTFRGLLALDHESPGRAAAYFNKALNHCGEEKKRETLLGMAGLYLNQNEVDKAEALITDLGKKDPSPGVGMVSSTFWAFLGNFSKAIETSSDYASRYPEDERFPTLLASFYLVMDERQKARDSAAQALFINPRYSGAYSVLAEYYLLEGKGKEAEDACRKAIDLDPRNAVARNTLGLVRTAKGYFDEARREFSTAAEMMPKASMVWSNRGLLWTLIEELQQARKDYNKALETDPSNYLALNGEGLVALKEGRTEEAVQYFLKSGLQEPRIAQPHIFLSVAYYQLGDVSRAMDEVNLAASLDPLDPIPHLIAYIIYQDTYRPFDAVREAKKVLELYPNLKNINEIEDTRAALSNVGTALLGLGMAEWAENYAQESYNPYHASSHFQASRQYNNNHTVSVSELVQGLLIDPLANSSATRYQDIIRRPRYNLTLNTTLGEEGGGFSQQYSVIFQGYTRKPWEIAYSLALQGYDNDGAVENGFSKGYNLSYGMGIKPDYQNSFNLGLFASKSRTGLPGTKYDPDLDDRVEMKNYALDLGYRHRFGPRNDLLARIAYDHIQFNFINSDPYGTRLTDFQLSFLKAGFLTETTRSFFKKGVYDLTAIFGGPTVTLATDSTGTLATIPGAERLSSVFPYRIDIDPRYRDKTSQDTLLFQVRHLLNIKEDHELTYGLEYIPFRSRKKVTFNRVDSKGTIDFFIEPFLNPGEAYTFPLTSTTVVTEKSKTDGRFVTAYLDDRWRLSRRLLIEGGLFFESFQDEDNHRNQLYPRIGLAFNLFENHTLRAGCLRWLEKSTSGTLAPVTTAGLVIDNSLTLQASRLTDYQARIESRWTDRFFTVVGVERSDLKDPHLGAGLIGRELSTKSLMAAINSILSERVGVFLRYRYTDSKGTEGLFEGKTVPGIPKHFLNGGVVWVSPLHVKAILFSNYVGEQFQDYSNRRKVSDYWTANFAATWEPFNKRGRLSLAVNNILAAGDPTPARSVFLTLEYRL